MSPALLPAVYPHLLQPVGAGDVVLKDTYERCIKPEGAYNGHKLHKGDVQDLQVRLSGSVRAVAHCLVSGVAVCLCKPESSSSPSSAFAVQT